MNRVSIRNKTFGFDGAEQEHTLTAVIVNAASIQRAYYSEAFDVDKPQTPVCWSSNTQYPDADVPEMQATRCMDCRHNIRGGAVGGGRSCKFSQNIAIVFPADLEKVYQLRVPANSIFGRAKGNLMPLQEYARFLNKHDTVCSEIYTKVYFDDDSIVPKLFFAPTKPLKVTGIDIVAGMISHPDTLKAIALDFNKGQESFSPFEKTEGFKITG
tara:strand:- start:1747 stop:2385 length:639 start_codon:yes stop_codon:yes gene_type:complete